MEHKESELFEVTTGNQVPILKRRWKTGQGKRWDKILNKYQWQKNQTETSHAWNFSACCQQEKEHQDRDLELAWAPFWCVNRHVFICFLTSKPGPTTYSHCSPRRQRKPALVHTNDSVYLWTIVCSPLQYLFSVTSASLLHTAGK